MKKAYGLSSFDDETKFGGICEPKELRGEAVDIIDEYGLSPVVFTKDDIERVWKDFNWERNSPIITRSVVTSSNWREYYDLRRVCWLHEWLGRWGELRAIGKQRPTQKDYLMFFTIRGDISWLNLKQTSFNKCIEYVRQLGLKQWRRGTS